MNKPRNATFDRNRETSTLFFRDYDDSSEFYLRGGVYWPSAESNGFVLLAGREVQTNMLWVFEEIEFQTIDDVIQDGQIRFPGVSHFFNKAWAKYYAKLYFWDQPQDLHKRFSLQVYRSNSIEPKPGFIEISLTDKDEAQHIVFEHIRTGRLVLDKESELARQLESTRIDGDSLFPAVEACGRALAGLARFPFNRHSVEPAADI